jgi:hypothetical protein
MFIILFGDSFWDRGREGVSGECFTEKDKAGRGNPAIAPGGSK